MADTDTLAALESAHTAFMVTVEGLPYAWCTDADLARLDYCGDGRTLKPGLGWPRYTLETDLIDGQPREHETTFVLQDEHENGYLAALFASFDSSEENLLTSFGPGDTPPAAANSKHVGTEFIGAAGERQQYPALPTQVQAGWEHLGETSHEHPTAVPSTLSDNPLLMRGRRVVLYECYRDHTLDLSSGLVFAPILRTLDDPVSGESGTATGTRYVPSRKGRYFDGDSEVIEWSSPYDATSGDLSLRLRVRLDDMSSTRRVLEIEDSVGNGALVVDVLSDGRVQLNHVHSTTNCIRRTVAAVTAGDEAEIVITYDGSGTFAGMHVYVDGSEPSYGHESNGAGTPRDFQGSWNLGRATSISPVGVLSTPQGWSAILTSTQVTSLYRNGWRPWSEARRRWIGTLLDSGQVDGKKWTIRARGWGSWIDKELGTLSQGLPVPIRKPITLTTEQRQAAILLSSKEKFFSTPANERSYGYASFGDSLGTWTGQLDASYGSVDDLIADLINLVEEAEADTTGDAGIAFNALNHRGNSVDMLAAGGPGGAVRIRTDEGDYFAQMELVLHDEVWRTIGYDPTNQTHLSLGDDMFVQFMVEENDEGDLIGPPEFPFNPAATYTGTLDIKPSQKYVTALFTTQAKVPAPIPQTQLDNGGEPRTWQPRYPGGTDVLPADTGTGVEILLGNPFDSEPWHTGQLDRPVASDPADPTQGYPVTDGDCDTQGLWLIQGPRRIAGEDEAEDEAQIARISWIEGEYGRVDMDESTFDINAVITEWLDPRDYGIERDKLDGTWAILANASGEQQVTATPILRLGYRPDGYSHRPDVMLQRLLLSTGTSTGWSSFANDASATIDPGDNEPTALSIATLDAEIPDLGLAVPRELVHDPVTFAVEYDKLHGPGTSYLNWQLAFIPPLRTREIFKGLFEALGWCWHFRDGKFGIFSPSDTFTPDDSDVTITQSEKRGSLRDMRRGRTAQDLRAYAPVDHFRLNYDWNPLDDSHNEKTEVRSPDKGARYRPRSSDRTASPLSIRSAAGWDLRVQQLAKFWERRHFWLKNYPIKGRVPGRNIWPGTIVTITEPNAVAVDGTYEITAYVGIVTRVSFDYSARPDGVCTADILVQDRDDDTWTLYAPSARAIGYDSSTSTLALEDNWLGLDTDGWLDVNAFVRPSWWTSGNAMLVEALQWDGDTWNTTLQGTVSSIDATAGACRLTLSGTSGTYQADDDAIIRPSRHAAQLVSSTWAADLLGVICDEDGFYTGTTLGKKWMG